MDLTKYEKIFAHESEKYLKELDDLLMQIEKDLINRDLWSEIHGKIHSIKGMARALSLDKIVGLSHCMESWCKEYQQGSMDATPNAVQLLFDGSDLLRLLVARRGDIDSLENQRWYRSLISQFKNGPEESADKARLDRPPHSPALPMTQRIDYLRVKYSLIEELLGLSQEILLSEKTLPPLSQQRLPSGLKNWIEHYASILKTLYFRLTQLRLMSVGDFADLFLKAIRDLAKEHNKQVRFEVQGGDVQADIALLERLREPFIHLFRNAIVHGIELPDERMRRGKDAEGKITLEARRIRDGILIKITDDGRGINRLAIIKHLKDKRSMTDEQIARMPQEKFLDTILSPDFSSVSETTDMAGRGIGMNVVAQAIEYLGGSMSIHSGPSKGTGFVMRLPLSLSIIYAITFRIDRYTLSIPTSNVASIERRERISPESSTSFCDLRSLLGTNNSVEESSYVLKLKRDGEESNRARKSGDIEVVVDGIVGNRSLMVMPVGELLAKAGLFAGVGITESGDISVLLDVENLLQVRGPPVGTWSNGKQERNPG